MPFTVRQQLVGHAKALWVSETITSHDGHDLHYRQEHRMDRDVVRSMHKFVERYKSPGDPPAWDILFDLFPDDMLNMLKEELTNGSESE